MLISINVALEQYCSCGEERSVSFNFEGFVTVSDHEHGDAQQTSLSSDDVISRQQVDALDALINKSDASSRLIPYLYANI